jgi:hypothetical protein
MKLLSLEERYPILKDAYYIYNEENCIIFKVYIENKKAYIFLDKRYEIFKRCTKDNENFNTLWESTTPVWDFIKEFDFLIYILDSKFKKSMLLQINPYTYVYIGNKIYTFVLFEKILYFKDGTVLTQNMIIDFINRTIYKQGIKEKLVVKQII